MEMNSTHEKAAQAMLYGQTCALRLKKLLDHPSADSGPVSSHDLAKSIVDCFSNAISILSHKPRSQDEYQFSYLFSSDSSASPPPSTPPQESHTKKRKIGNTNSSANWRDDSPVPHCDGYLWRKYGQKQIKKSNHQRSYYRCSYHIEHNCVARKYEQKIQDNPPVYRTTYFGHHTCQTEPNLDAILATVQDPSDDLKSGQIIRFGKDLDHKKESHSGGFSLPVKNVGYIIKEQTMDQYREITRDDQDSHHLMKQDLSSPSCSYPPPTSSGSESDEIISELLHNLDSWIYKTDDNEAESRQLSTLNLSESFSVGSHHFSIFHGR